MLTFHLTPSMLTAPGQLSIIISCVGIVTSIILIFLFLHNRHGYVVSEASLCLSLALLCGIIYLYLINFSYIYTNTEENCGFQRFSMGVAYVLCYSTLLLKTVRLILATHNSDIYGSASYISSTSQLLWCCTFVTVQLVMTVEWLVLIEPGVGYYHFTSASGEASGVWLCSHSGEQLIASMWLFFLVWLINLGCLLVYRSWKVYSHEAVYTLVTLVISLLITVTWMLVYTLVTSSDLASDEELRDAAVCFGNSLVATALLGIMFLPRVLALYRTANMRDRVNGSGSPTLTSSTRGIHNPGLDYGDSSYVVPRTSSFRADDSHQVQNGSGSNPPHHDIPVPMVDIVTKGSDEANGKN